MKYVTVLRPHVVARFILTSFIIILLFPLVLYKIIYLYNYYGQNLKIYQITNCLKLQFFTSK